MSQGITGVGNLHHGEELQITDVGGQAGIACKRRGNSGALQALPSELGGAGSEATRRVARQQPGFSRGDFWGCSWCFPQAYRSEQSFSLQSLAVTRQGLAGRSTPHKLLLPSPARPHPLVPPVPMAPLSPPL